MKLKQVCMVHIASTSSILVCALGVLAQQIPPTSQLEETEKLVACPTKLSCLEVILSENASNLKLLSSVGTNNIRQIVWSRHGNELGLVGWQEPVEIRDAASLGFLETFGGGKEITRFSFSPKEDIVAYCEKGENDVTILNRRTGGRVCINTESDEADVVFSPDGATLATGGSGSPVKLWQVKDGRLSATFNVKHFQGGQTIAFSPDGRLLAVGERSFTKLFDVATRALLRIFPKSGPSEIRFHPRGHTLAVTYISGDITLWRVSDATKNCEREGVAKQLCTIDWSPDGGIVATAGRDSKITLWFPDDLSMLRELPSLEWVTCVRFSPDGKGLYYLGSNLFNGRSRQIGMFRIVR